MGKTGILTQFCEWLKRAMRGRLTGPAEEVHVKATAAAAAFSLLALGFLCGGAAGSAGGVSGLRGAAAPREWRCAFPARSARPCGVLRLRGGQAGDGGEYRSEGVCSSRIGATDAGSTNTTTSGTGESVKSTPRASVPRRLALTTVAARVLVQEWSSASSSSRSLSGSIAFPQALRA